MPKRFARIAFPIPLTDPFTYRVPDELRDSVAVGKRVMAPLGRRRAVGYIVELTDATKITELKDLQDVLDDAPLFSGEMWKLLTWISEYYFCSLGEALRGALPAGINLETERVVELTQALEEEEIEERFRRSRGQAAVVRLLSREGRMSIKRMERRLGVNALNSVIRRLEQVGVVRIDPGVLKKKVERRWTTWINLTLETDSPELADQMEMVKRRAPKQGAMLEILRLNKGRMLQQELMERALALSSSLNALEQKGLVTKTQQEVERSYFDVNPVAPEDPRFLNIRRYPLQEEAFQQVKATIDEKKFGVHLLHGVTGSGKTQVYIDVLKEVAARGQAGIILVPEISLTPQTVRRFSAHFPGIIAVLHSRMSDGERYDAWRRIRSGKYRIVIGARSAIFAPVRELGVVVVDEEHESTYKQDNVPRYHARDVAIMRARLNDAVVILGSATPSLESFHNARTGKYNLISLPHRVDNVPMPEVALVDMRKAQRQRHPKTTDVLARDLHEKIEDRLAKKEQVILLQNRRGYAPILKCKDCGFVAECPNCNISLTYHLVRKRLVCHYCNYRDAAPDECPECNGRDVIFRGLGTQKVEESLRETFPGSRLVRMDLDTTRGRGAHNRILLDFEKGKYDILLGTQMVAKGLDFERVTLVGVISADTGLHMPDFRAGERTFQLLTQVAGRAGRRTLPGEVVTQTYSPEDRAVVLSQAQDYAAFYEYEIANRKELMYPPFSRMVKLLFHGVDAGAVQNLAREFGQKLRTPRPIYQVLGPASAPLERLKNQYRWQIILKINRRLDPQGRATKARLFDLLKQHRIKTRRRDVAVVVDVDPVYLL